MTVFIAICEDNPIEATQIEAFLLTISAGLKISFEIDVYTTGEELCSKMAEGIHYDLIFLDIQLGDDCNDGVDVGRIIRDELGNSLVHIVYISWEQSYSMSLHRLQILDFLIKPLNFEELERVIKTFVKVESMRSGALSFKKGHDIYKINIKDILFLESADRKIIIHKQGGDRERFYGSLKKIYENDLIKYDFLFIHASYVVNYDFVEVFKYEELIIKGGKTLPISQSRRKFIRDAHYAIRNRRGS
ncbi:MAG: LytTR family DNA-binding domain-containing protein [Clostridiales bacterium]|jgi:DNA-binding LytR/AlgR family response regulator|nr:LytTR family DNA-binding domain-containing protein [Clostridiales bacterium]